MLTGRQQEIWKFLTDYVDEHGYPPTVREIGEAVGLASPSTVHAHLANLERAGLIKRDPTKPRALELRRDPKPTAAQAEDVDSVMAEAERGGARITRQAGETFWGGYAGIFVDPEGHPWEIAHNPHWTLEEDGSVRLA